MQVKISLAKTFKFRWNSLSFLAVSRKPPNFFVGSSMSLGNLRKFRKMVATY